jgi:hypothetical protein
VASRIASSIGSIPRRDLTILAGLVGVALVLDTYCLGCKSLWWDEGFTLTATQVGWSEIGKGLISSGSNPLFFVLVRGWGALGQGEAFIRVLSVPPAVATIPVIYWLGRELFDRTVGLVAAALITTNSFVVEYAQTARGYSLVLFLTTLSSLFLVRAVKQSTKGRWIAYVVVTVAALATQIFAFGVVIAQLAALALTQPRASKGDWVRRVLVPLLLMTPVLALPAAWFIFVRTGLRWIPPPSMIDLITVPLVLAGQARAYRTLILLGPAGAVLLFTNAVAMIPLVLLGRNFMTKGRSPALWPHAFLVLWFTIPVVGSFLASLVFPIFLDRYLIVVVPAIAILTAVGLSRLPSRWMSITTLTVICGVAVLSLANYYGEKKEDWRGVADYVQSHSGPNDGLIIYRPGGTAAFSYYARRDPRPDPEFAFPNSGDPIDGSDVDSLFASLRNDEIGYERIWLISSHVPLEDNDARRSAEDIELRRLLYSDFEVVDQKRYAGINLELLQEI